MKYNCAVIGCGRIGCGYEYTDGMVRNHAAAYAKNRATSLSALCDVDKNSLKKCGSKFNVTKLYTSYEEMFEKEDLDIVSICTLVDTHFKIVKKAVEHDVKGIFLEKPMADNLENGKKIVELCNKNNTQLQIDHQRRFIPVYHQIRDFLANEKLGKIQNVNVYYGSGVANTGSHLFDILLFLFGHVKSVEGKYSFNPSNNKMDPNIDGKIDFKNNVSCSINSLDISHYGILEMNILGTKGRLKIDMVKHSVDYYVPSKNKFLDYTELSNVQFYVKKLTTAPILVGVNNIIDAIRDKDKLLCSSLDGYKSLEVIVALNLSAQKRSVISFPLCGSKFKIQSR